MKTKTRFIPSTYTKEVRREDLDAVAYVSEDGVRAIFFQGKRSKPTWHYRFRTAEACSAGIEKTFKDIAERLEQRAQRKQEKRSAASEFLSQVKVGTILECSWGYSMTIVDFYQVVAVNGARIQYRKILSESKNEGYLSGHSMPCPNDFAGNEPVRTSIAKGKYLRVDGKSHQRAGIWDGQPAYYNHCD